MPRLLAMLCILAVFIPSFFMQGAARALFVPLSLAVGFAMIACYLLSSTFVPVLSRLAAPKQPRGRRKPAERQSTVRGFCRRPSGLTTPPALAASSRSTCSSPAAAVVPGWPAARHGDLPAGGCRAVPVPAARPRPARASSRPRRSRRRLCEFIGDEVRRRRRTSRSRLGYVGVVPSSYPINSVYLWMGGPEEAVMRVALKPGTVRVEDLKAAAPREAAGAPAGVDRARSG